MANLLTGLIPDIYAASDVVSREQVGMIPAVTIDSEASKAALGQKVNIPIANEVDSSDVVAGVTSPDDGDQIIKNRSISITKSRRVPVRWNGEQSLAANHGPGTKTIIQEQFEQAMRTLCNEVEADLTALYKTTSAVSGTPGDTPFSIDLSSSAYALKALQDNGSPTNDLQLVVDTTVGANLRSLGQLNKVDQAGNSDLLRKGDLTDLHGFNIRESAKVNFHTQGTGSGYQVNNHLGYVKGSKVIKVDTGAGTILPGDVITFLGDNKKYIIETGLNNGEITIADPGIQSYLPDNTPLTIEASYTAHMAFSKSAIILAIRPPASPDEGDLAKDRMIIKDDFSGLVFEVSAYKQYRQIQYEVSISWGMANIKPEHTGILRG